jgi:hypothetical protein
MGMVHFFATMLCTATWLQLVTKYGLHTCSPKDDACTRRCLGTRDRDSTRPLYSPQVELHGSMHMTTQQDTTNNGQMHCLGVTADTKPRQKTVPARTSYGPSCDSHTLPPPLLLPCCCHPPAVVCCPPVPWQCCCPVCHLLHPQKPA